MSDYIGCMSEANSKYVIRNNVYLDQYNIEICPNTINPIILEKTKEKNQIRARYNLPLDKIILIYGGNFGKPQNVDYIINVLKDNENNNEIHFVMVGSGTDFFKIKEYKNEVTSEFFTVLDNLNKREYAELLDACDVGLIFLDHRFTIPNFPSRVLDYMNHEIPVLAATDVNSDIGQVIVNGNFGWWCESSDIKTYKEVIALILLEKDMLSTMGKNGKIYLEKYYRTEIAYNAIMKHFNKNEMR